MLIRSLCSSILRSVARRDGPRSLVFGRGWYSSSALAAAPAAAPKVIMNQDIKFPTVRMVYVDEAGASKTSVLSRDEALKFAKSMKMDLVLIKGDVDPPVCKVVDFEAAEKARLAKEREAARAAKTKQKEMREVHIGANIDDHDLDTKLSKIKQFLEEGSEVKIVINGNKKLMIKHPDSMDRTTLKLLDRVEGLVSSVKQPAVKLGEFRKDFILTPKSAQPPAK